MNESHSSSASPKRRRFAARLSAAGLPSPVEIGKKRILFDAVGKDAGIREDLGMGVPQPRPRQRVHKQSLRELRVENELVDAAQTLDAGRVDRPALDRAIRHDRVPAGDMRSSSRYWHTVPKVDTTKIRSGFNTSAKLRMRFTPKSSPPTNAGYSGQGYPWGSPK